jgi:hypothetical protein
MMPTLTASYAKASYALTMITMNEGIGMAWQISNFQILIEIIAYFHNITFSTFLVTGLRYECESRMVVVLCVSYNNRNKIESESVTLRLKSTVVFV